MKKISEYISESIDNDGHKDSPIAGEREGEQMNPETRKSFASLIMDKTFYNMCRSNGFKIYYHNSELDDDMPDNPYCNFFIFSNSFKYGCMSGEVENFLAEYTLGDAESFADYEMIEYSPSKNDVLAAHANDDPENSLFLIFTDNPSGSLVNYAQNMLKLNRLNSSIVITSKKVEKAAEKYE